MSELPTSPEHHPFRLTLEGVVQTTLTLKLLFLVLNRSEKEWTMPAREWCMAKAQFAILFGERFTRALA